MSEMIATMGPMFWLILFFSVLALAVLAVTAVLAGLWLIVTDRKAAPVEETK